MDDALLQETDIARVVLGRLGLDLSRIRRTCKIVQRPGHRVREVQVEWIGQW